MKELLCLILCLMLCCPLAACAEENDAAGLSAAGVAVMTAEAHVETTDYWGHDLVAGEVITTTSADGTLPIMRGMTCLPVDTFTFRPFVPVENAKPGDLLWAYTTYYSDENGEARAHHIELASQRINGTTIQPGTEFSFNSLCAPYTSINGYEKTPGVSQPGVADGVCQVSTTLSCAVLGLGLDIRERKMHGPAGVIYAPMGSDCAVTQNNDFIFVNTLDVPITITALPQHGALTVRLSVMEE